MTAIARDPLVEGRYSVPLQYTTKIIRWKLMTDVASGVRDFITQCGARSTTLLLQEELYRQVEKSKNDIANVYNKKTWSESELGILLSEIELALKKLKVKGDTPRLIQRYQPQDFIILYTHSAEENTETIQVFNMLQDNNAYNDVSDAIDDLTDASQASLSESTKVSDSKSTSSLQSFQDAQKKQYVHTDAEFIPVVDLYSFQE